jgi:hypothetical protein
VPKSSSRRRGRSSHVPRPIRNVAMEGLIEEGHELIDEIEK